ncbi:MAG: hypothetical protein HQM16_13925 [Deltaproteobacteria bacterium]|nr:hypothetical protein [Deltaproteobacteria bacterium]
MFKLNKKSFAIVAATLGAFIGSHLTYAADTYDNKKTTTVEQTTTQSATTKPRPVVVYKRAKPVMTKQTTTVTIKEGALRTVLDEDALKKMLNNLCVEGFRAYVGNDKKNVCQGKATTPDIAYSCIWKENGNAAFAPTDQGPCALDYAEHKDSIIITKDDYTSSPPLAYGTEAQCCFRAGQGPDTKTSTTGPVTQVTK